MSKKVIIHGVLLGGLVIYTWVAWSQFESSQLEREKRLEDVWSEVGDLNLRAETASGMIQVAVPLLVTSLYGAALAIIYGLPVLVERVIEGMLGSNAEVDPDPMHDGRAAVAAGEYSEAIAVYHDILRKEPGNRKALLEIAKIQRSHLTSPALADNTLEEGLRDFDWEGDDRACLMFHMAEIYEEDLHDRKKAIEVLKEVGESLPETRHAELAEERLREWESE